MTGTTMMPRVASLTTARRFGGVASPSDRLANNELAILLFAGVVSALASAIIRGWGIPGSTVVQGVLPMAAGLAFVPRRGAGILMGGSAIVSGMLFMQLGVGHNNPSALVRLALLGMCLDAGPARLSRDSLIWVWFVLAGLSANLLGLGAKYVMGLMGLEGLMSTGHLFYRAVSYGICGALAGGISAVIFFRRRGGQCQTGLEKKEGS